MPTLNITVKGTVLYTTQVPHIAGNDSLNVPIDAYLGLAEFKQAEQEPVEVGYVGEFVEPTKAMPAGTKLYADNTSPSALKAAFKEGFERASDLLAEPAEQEPVGYVDEALRIKWLIDYDAVSKLTGHKLYAAPFRTKDLTDEDIQKLRHKIDWTAEWSYVSFARAVIAADREKNKCQH